MQEEENASKRRELTDLLGSETLEDCVKRLGDERPGDVNQVNLLSSLQPPLNVRNTAN